MNANDIWHATLGELQLQMTRATFDQWVRPTHAVEYKDGIFTVGVHSPYAKEWLENRLNTSIQRTVTGIVGKSVNVLYVVQDQRAHIAREEQRNTVDHEDSKTTNAMDGETDSPSDVQVTLIQSPLKPFLMVSKYSFWFWQPLLGCEAFSIYQMLRSIGKEWEGWGKTNRVNVEVIALTLGLHRQTITGRTRDGEHIDGKFDALNQNRVARITLNGEGRDAYYEAKVLHELPLLTPKQVLLLPELIQERHRVFMKEFEIDYEAWKQLEFDTQIRLDVH